MVWWYTKTRHELSCNTFVRRWLAGSFLDRMILSLVPAAIAAFFGIFFVFAGASAMGGLLLLGLFLMWSFCVVDWFVDHFPPRADLAEYLKRDDVILGTRCEYLGGHPLLPQGRFAYLLLEGTRENPNLTLGFPAPTGGDLAYFQMPVLDLAGTSQESAPGESPGGELVTNMLAAYNMNTNIKEGAARLLMPQKLTFIVEYRGDGGGSYKVELANFLGGNEELRNWQNYLVCARGEALTGQRPFGPWKSLRSEPPDAQEVSGDYSRHGPQPTPIRRSAFARR